MTQVIYLSDGVRDVSRTPQFAVGKKKIRGWEEKNPHETGSISTPINDKKLRCDFCPIVINFN